MEYAHWTPQPAGHPAIRARECSGRVRVRFTDTDAGVPVWVDADVLSWEETP